MSATQSENTFANLNIWLVAIGAGLFFSAVLEVIGVIPNIIYLYSAYRIHNHSWAICLASSDHFFLLMVFELIYKCLVLGALIFLIALFLRRSQRFPIVYMFFTVFALLAIVFDWLFCSNLGTAYNFRNADFVHSVFPALWGFIWVPYLFFSKSIRSIFFCKSLPNLSA